MKLKTTKKRYFSEVFKLSIVQAVLCGKVTKEAARRKYGIKGKSAILSWLRKFGPLLKLDTTMPLNQKKKQDLKNSKAKLLKENEMLKKQLEDEKLRAAAYS